MNYPIPQHLLVDTVTVEPFTGSSAYGAIYGTAFSVKCRYEEKYELKVDANGREQLSKGRFFCNPGYNIVTESKITYGSAEYNVILVNIYSESHMEVYVA